MKRLNLRYQSMSGRTMADGNTVLVSIIIRCFNEEKHIENLLRSLTTQRHTNCEIIIVDSGSTDRTLEIVKDYPVHVVQIKPEEFTFGYSLNCGCRIARGRYLIFASAHVIPYNDVWIDELIAPFGDPDIAIVYGKQIGNHKTKYSERQVFAQQFPPVSNLRQKTPFCNNANCAIRRSVWEQYRYDESLTGLEDLDMGKKVLEDGKLIAYNSKAVIYHIHEELPGMIFNRYKREAIALKNIFPDSHLSIMEFLVFWISNIVLDVVRSIKDRMFIKSIGGIFMFRTMQYFGMFTGIRNRTRVTHEMIMKFYYPRKPHNGIFKRKI